MTFAARFTKTLDKILRTYTDQDYPEEVINESRDSLLILNQLLEREASTQEYVDFLSDRYAIIQNTFSDFKANLHTRANVASMALSKFLSQEHLKKTGKVIDSQTFLTPAITVRGFAKKLLNDLEKINSDLPDAYNVFVYLESQKRLSELKKLLENSLNSREETSIFSLEPFVLFLKNVSTNPNRITSANLLPGTNANQACQSLARAICYYANVNKYTYENNNPDKLFYLPKKNALTLEAENNLRADFLTTLTTREELIHCFCLLPEKKWPELLSQIPNFQQILLHDVNSVDELLSKKESLYNEDEKRSKAILYCLWETYELERKQGPEFNTFIGATADFLRVSAITNYFGVFSVYSREVKVTSIRNAIELGLLSKNSLHDFEACIPEDNKAALKFGRLKDFMTHLEYARSKLPPPVAKTQPASTPSQSIAI